MATHMPSSHRRCPCAGSARIASQIYSPYGVANAAALPVPGFCGQWRDTLTGSYALGNGRRFYNPSLKRFSSADAFSPFGRGGINAYVYCGGDPVNRRDPSGAFWISLLLRTIALMSSGATLLGATVRTARNVVGRRSMLAQQPVATAGRRVSRPSLFSNVHLPHEELSHQTRVANQMFGLTGAAGIASHVALMASGVPAGVSSVADAFGLVNTVSNLSGGLAGTSNAAMEVGRYLVANPTQAGSVAYETIMDLTMLDEGLSGIGRGVTSLARRVRSNNQTLSSQV